MNKIVLIIKREYITRVKKKSFLLMSLLGPILMGALFIVPIWLATHDDASSKILVVDETNLFGQQLKNTKNIKFEFDNLTFEEGNKAILVDRYEAMLYIPANLLNSRELKIYYRKPVGALTESYIQDKIEDCLFKYKLIKNNVNVAQIEAAKTKISILTKKVNDDGAMEDTSTSANMILGFGGAIVIYFLIFLYGIQVMRGVMEEKSNRIIEVIISSVKPFELMMGKIIGIALVGFTQFLLWIVLTGFIYTTAQNTILKGFKDKVATYEMQKDQVLKKGADLSALQTKSKDPSEMIAIIKGFMNIDYKLMLISFVIYFLGGYLLYSALFAAVGAAVDSETDTQQFMLPITIPLIFSFIVAQNIMQNPDSTLGFWCSLIPFTSPITMMVRLPFGVPMWQLILSMVLLFLGFIGTTMLAAKIYRTGILMYGKKISWKEMWKWLFYKA